MHVHTHTHTYISMYRYSSLNIQSSTFYIIVDNFENNETYVFSTFLFYKLFIELFFYTTIRVRRENCISAFKFVIYHFLPLSLLEKSM